MHTNNTNNSNKLKASPEIEFCNFVTILRDGIKNLGKINKIVFGQTVEMEFLT